MARTIQNILCKAIVGLKVNVTHSCELIWWYDSMTRSTKIPFYVKLLIV